MGEHESSYPHDWLKIADKDWVKEAMQLIRGLVEMLRHELDPQGGIP